MAKQEQLNLIKRLISLSDLGLFYAQDPYDQERYTELKQIGLELLGSVTDVPLKQLKHFFMPPEDYPTAKVDIRAFVLNDAGHILLAQEGSDGKWTIPGGWADIGNTPKEVAEKEVWEETGIAVKVNRLLAVYDKQRHPHPEEPFYIYKLVYACTMVGGELNHGFDMLNAAWFALENLPELSTPRILKSQLIQLHAMVLENKLEVYSD
ncbi:NUDIX hydrolase [Croceivirga sp. JEA036]|uniref:NUDIX hydrolase n=1 Tax=Croceivirga sp. JEA036 TaxID=2721162 RepID=UPI00143A74FC|nr:NUDIX hydrolase [Croceivirga sp. JEA036]NJB36878.1 NUDIX hydrolase [Croceivirga sp. JEA036]